ncbi:MAG: decarboxylase [Bdellovibrio sp.]|nr:MAG: decarboxylase [Bdellovibrio sp.]
MRGDKMSLCDPEEVALKTFFLGPQAENASWVLDEVEMIFRHWFQWRRRLFPKDGVAISEKDQKEISYQEKQKQFRDLLHNLLNRYEKEVPKFSPRYIGHMVSETSLPALFGHMITLLHNPNNISGEVSKVGALLEKEAIAFLSEMLGFDVSLAQGHFTSGGTVANIEALWRARFRMDHWLALGCYERSIGFSSRDLIEYAHRGWKDFKKVKDLLSPEDSELRFFSFVANAPWRSVPEIEKVFGQDFKGPVVLVPNNKHYSWQKAVSLLGLGETSLWSVALDPKGQLCIKDLQDKIKKALLQQRPVLMVVSVAGTTELGEIDSIDEVQDVLDSYKEKGIEIWHHVDGAYGGFFCSLLGDPYTEEVLQVKDQKALKSISRTHSVTIDPHKLGYVPFSCGAIIVHNEEDYETSSFSAPYVLQKNLNTWMRTLEGSRSATGAAATWLTALSIGLGPHGYGRIIRRSIWSKMQLEEQMKKEIAEAYFVPGCTTNILCFCIAFKGESLSEVSRRSEYLYEQFPLSGPFYVSRTVLKFENYGELLKKFIQLWEAPIDQDSLCVLRLVLMNPFFTSKETQISFPEAFVHTLKELILKFSQK